MQEESAFQDSLLKDEELNVDLNLNEMLKQTRQGGLRGKFVDLKARLKEKQHLAMKMLRAVSPLHFKNKVSFALGVANVIAVPYIMGAFPKYFPFVHSVEVVFLVLFRLAYYFVLQKHYFLLDFCYFANVLTLLNLGYSIKMRHFR